ncbi:MAG: adenylate/guanylate cyclase domain-containing protein, partial [Flavobacteriales bacterium]|nr:adenylate/guanylate cyclase domain-containing protein [Flavobacteriales bacterium]
EKKERQIKELEVHKLSADLREEQLTRTRNIYLFTGLGVLLVAGGLWSRLRYTRRAKAVLQVEKDRSEELLLNILPEEVAEELKAKGEADAVQIDHVTVLFTDFKGFTALSEQVTPKQLVKDLHECFSAFDHICEDHGLEKIKTIGDAYMAAGGLPVPNDTHASDAIAAALEMRDFIAEGKARKIAAGLPYFEVRIGIHTGPVVAGIVGVKKFSYDIWGDTVNTASRMESSGEPGKVNLSGATYSLVRDLPMFTFTPRGKVQAKGKGELEMYFVERG